MLNGILNESFSASGSVSRRACIFEKKLAMVNSRQKGAAAERELAHKLNEMFHVDARRGQQFSGANGDADVVGIPGVHIEAKRVENLNLAKAFDQSERDAKNRGELPVVIHRKSRKPWMITLRLEDLPELARIIKEVSDGVPR